MRELKKTAFAIVTVCILSACGSDSEAKKFVLSSLKDPDSAKFGEITFVKSPSGKLEGACVSVNAKNSMGGYTGEKQIPLMRKTGETWSIIPDVSGNWTHAQCISMTVAAFADQ